MSFRLLALAAPVAIFSASAASPIASAAPLNAQYCPTAGLYYPAVLTCAVSWQTVPMVPRPPNAAPVQSPVAPAAVTTPPPPPPTPAIPASAALSPPSAAFQEGLAARADLETWFAGTQGDEHAGALFWTAQRSLAHPGSCADPSMSQAWQDGCTAAQKRLALPDARRKSEPDYRKGWNSWVAPISVQATPPIPEQRAASAATSAAEFIGFGSRVGMDATVISKQGIGTAHAVIRAHLTEENGKRYCEGYVEDSSPRCIEEYLKGTKITDSITADCETGVFTTFYGDNLQFVGRNKLPDSLAEYIVQDLKAGSPLDGSMASGLPYDMEQFDALCPGAKDKIVVSSSTEPPKRTDTPTDVVNSTESPSGTETDEQFIGRLYKKIQSQIPEQPNSKPVTEAEINAVSQQKITKYCATATPLYCVQFQTDIMHGRDTCSRDRANASIVFGMIKTSNPMPPKMIFESLMNSGNLNADAAEDLKQIISAAEATDSNDSGIFSLAVYQLCLKRLGLYD
jgi:hypothetical protein